MKIGILSDIHGNAYALEAVLKDAKRLGVQQLLILGDFVGHYFQPDKVLELLSSWKYDAIKGNHENILKEYIKKDPIYNQKIIQKYGKGHEFCLKLLSLQSINDLINLPEILHVNYDDVSMILAHGSPWDTNYYIYPDADQSDLNKCDIPNTDFVFLGHTHYPFSYHGLNTHIINVGSVGQSRVTGGIANWGIINTRNKVFTAKNTLYNTDLLIQDVKKKCPEQTYLSLILTRNRD